MKLKYIPVECSLMSLSAFPHTPQCKVLLFLVSVTSHRSYLCSLMCIEQLCMDISSAWQNRFISVWNPTLLLPARINVMKVDANRSVCFRGDHRKLTL